MNFYGLLFISFICTLMACGGNNKSNIDCSQWHTGSYEIVDEGRNILIERDAQVQTETDRTTSSYTKFAINWIDNCTYQLKFLEGEEGVYQAWKDNFMQVTITGPTPDGYAYIAQFSNSQRKEEGQIAQIK